MNLTNTLLLKRHDVIALLTLEESIAAVEKAFRLHGEGKTVAPQIIGIHSLDGGFHIKAGMSNLERTYFVAKANANFPLNMKRYGLSAIQGIIIVCDGVCGRLLALMDSIEITIQRTGAATAVAAKYLSRTDAKTVTISGCGNQGRISLKMLMKVRPIEKVYAFDIDKTQVKRFIDEFDGESLSVVDAGNLQESVMQSDICVTCTPSKHPYLAIKDIAPGTFIAAVGADSEEKQELEPALVASTKIVTDLLDQCVNIGELHHALQQGLLGREDVYAELGEIIAGKKPGRTSEKEIIIFDSTGTALQDVAVASIVYEKAVRAGIGVQLNFAD